MLSHANLIIEELDRINMKHGDMEEIGDEYIIETNFGLKSTPSMKILILVSKDTDLVGLRCWGFMRVTEEQYPKAVLACNELNKKNRFVKFYVDDDYDVNLEDDAIVDEETAGSEVVKLIVAMAAIADDSYPVINKAIWA